MAAFVPASRLLGSAVRARFLRYNQERPSSRLREQPHPAQLWRGRHRRGWRRGLGDVRRWVRKIETDANCCLTPRVCPSDGLSSTLQNLDFNKASALTLQSPEDALFQRISKRSLPDCVAMGIVVAKQSTLIIACLWACVKHAPPLSLWDFLQNLKLSSKLIISHYKRLSLV